MKKIAVALAAVLLVASVPACEKSDITKTTVGTEKSPTRHPKGHK